VLSKSYYEKFVEATKQNDGESFQIIPHTFYTIFASVPGSCSLFLSAKQNLISRIYRRWNSIEAL
jgi:hypothetical protein